MNFMRTSRTLLGLILCALPLLAGTAERRVAVPCERTTATVIASGKETEAEGRQFAVRVINHSDQTIAMPRSPIFGWRVESLEKGVWRAKAEGGPVRRVKPKDDLDKHVVAIGGEATTPLTEISPERSEDFFVFLPEAAQALRPQDATSTLKLTLFWAASAALARSNHAVPLCAIAPEWVLKIQKLPSHQPMP
jgi:hypothetical protein